jgi:hypothetical protein
MGGIGGIGGIGGGIGGIGPGLGGIGGGIGGVGSGLGSIAAIGGIGQFGGIGQQNPFPAQPRISIDPLTGQPVYPAGSLTFEELQARRQLLRDQRVQARQLGSAIAVAGFNFKEMLDALPDREDAEAQYDFQYVLDDKVSLARQKSALLPVFNEGSQLGTNCADEWTLSFPRTGSASNAWR